jgi:hypothetical protein
MIALIKLFRDEWKVVSGAPIVFILVLAIGGSLGFGAYKLLGSMQTTSSSQNGAANVMSNNQAGGQTAHIINNYGSTNVEEKEQARRNNLLMKLRNTYILSHDHISPALAAGLENPPDDWTNQELERLHENWRVKSNGAGYDVFPASGP